jgi:pyruvate formate lyase activating enzyme
VAEGGSSTHVRADLWRDWRGGPRVHCLLCAHHCRITPGERGLCGVRENRDGVLYTLVYGFPVSTAVDPIEKKPLFHFLPGSRSLSLATVGCNFTCVFCQNSDISQMPREGGRIVGHPLSPRQVVEEAHSSGCASISYTYTEPTVFYEYARDCAQLASSTGLRNVFVTNGYMTAEALRGLDGHLHAANVDLTFVGARLKPVVDSIRRLVGMGVWLEVTTLLIPGHNDGEEELRSLVAFLVSLSVDIPWHVSRFYPAYHLQDVPATTVASLETALRIGREGGLRYVYAGNIPGHPAESTRCHSCGETVIERQGFRLVRSGINKGCCPRCGARIPLYQEEVRG